MRRFLTKIAVFSIVIAVAYVPLYCILVSMHMVNPMPSSHHEVRNTEIKFNEIKNYRDVDILFVGASNAYRSFDVRKFSDKGMLTYNMGTSAQSPVHSYIILRQYIDSIRPKFVVMSVSPILMRDPTESTLDFLWSNFDEDKIQWEIMKSQMSLACKNMHIINTWIYNAFYHNIYDPISIHIGKHQKINRRLDGDSMMVDDKDMYIRGGYVERMKKMTCGVQKHESSLININRMQFYYLKECANLYESRNIPYVFVETPMQQTCYRAWINHEEWEYELRDFNYINYNGLILFNDTTDFYDSYHMNKYGVAKFDSIFIADMITSGYINLSVSQKFDN